MDISFLPFPLLLAVFAAAGITIWFAGIQVSKTTDLLLKHFKLGEALGGMILLAIVTNLPEVAIVVSSALTNNIGIAVGNILGGIAIQTVVIAVLDFWGLGKKVALTNSVNSLVPVLEGILVIAVLSMAVMGHELPDSFIFLRISPADVFILAFWIIGIYLINKAKTDLPWTSKARSSTLPPGKDEKSNGNRNGNQSNDKKNIKKNIIIFLACAMVTLVAGFAAELSSDAIAKHIGMQGVIFGATILAAITSLPEISTGLAALKIQDYEMAISDILGGNAFLPVLFFVATLITGKAVLPKAQKTDVYLTALAMLLTTVYVCGIVFRSKKQIFKMGMDSFIVILLYVIGILGLFIIK
ncbi:sodium:calcium antiporter [Segetibacter koreensis]|uniref:sodium:calcium antiporter n=1 Tax=Segetibacter koreensis TaxID=398037 RepID=UPI00036E661B|nr:hypothetical protein [Segetibacter koreensis]